jgi:hypothetical protein
MNFEVEHTENKTQDEIDRQRLTDQLHGLQRNGMSESMSMNAVRTAVKNDFEIQRIKAILWICDELNLPVKAVENCQHTDHIMIELLISEENIDAARRLVLDPIKARVDFPDHFKKAAEFVHEQTIKLIRG